MNLTRILITGAAGVVGTGIRDHLPAGYGVIRLLDPAPIAGLRPNETAIQGSILDTALLDQALAGIEGVIHLAGQPAEGNDANVASLNLVGTHLVFDAAKRLGVRRIVFASSNHAVGEYPTLGRPPADALVPRPDSLYGVSKAYAEAYLRYLAELQGMEAAAIRIGSFQPRPMNRRHMVTWLSPRDCAQLFHRALQADLGDPPFLVTDGFSGNHEIDVRDPAWERIGYRPEDDGFSWAERLKADGIDVTVPLPSKLGGELFHKPARRRA